MNILYHLCILLIRCYSFRYISSNRTGRTSCRRIRNSALHIILSENEYLQQNGCIMKYTSENNMKTEIERKPYCSCCSRRNFLKSFGTAIGAALLLPEELLAALPGPVNPATIPDKKGAVRVRLVLCTYGQKEISGIGWPHIGYDFRPFEKNVTDALNAGVKDVEFIPTKADDEADGEAIAMEDAKRGDIDGYLVIGMNCWNTAVLGIAKAGKPVLYTALPYGGDAGWLTNNSILRRNNQPAYEALSTFRFEDIVEMSGAFSKLKNGTADDYVKAARKWRLAHTPSKVRERAVEGHLDCLSVDDTLEAIRGMKMPSASYRSGRYASTTICTNSGCSTEAFTMTSCPFCTLTPLRAMRRA